MEAEFARIDRGDALARLAQAQVPSTYVYHAKELFNDPQIVANGLLVELQHSQWGKVWQTGVLAKFSGTPGKIERAAPLLGEHTDEVLHDYLGYDAAKIADLRARNIVR